MCIYQQYYIKLIPRVSKAADHFQKRLEYQVLGDAYAKKVCDAKLEFIVKEANKSDVCLPVL